MTLAELKFRIAKRFNTNADNIIVFIDNKMYSNTKNEENLSLKDDLNIDEFKMVKIEFKLMPLLTDKNDHTRNHQSKGMSSSVLVTTINDR
jgi:hypothetical protein